MCILSFSGLSGTVPFRNLSQSRFHLHLQGRLVNLDLMICMYCIITTYHECADTGKHYGLRVRIKGRVAGGRSPGYCLILSLSAHAT